MNRSALFASLVALSACSSPPPAGVDNAKYETDVLACLRNPTDIPPIKVSVNDVLLPALFGPAGALAAGLTDDPKPTVNQNVTACMKGKGYNIAPGTKF